MKRLGMTLVLLGALPQGAQAESSQLEKAYAKELAFLKAEKAALEARLGEADRSSVEVEGRLEAELGATEDRLLLARRRAEELETRLRGLERESDGEERSGVVRETLSRASETLASYGVVAPEEVLRGTETDLPAAVRGTFGGALQAMEDGTKFRREVGSFFLTDGRQVEGQIVHWGRIAAFGDSPEGSGALVPAGGGRLRIWEEPAAEVATALARGSSPAVLRAFLFESTETAVKKREEKSFLAELAAGGTIAYVIAALGLLAALMIIFRSVRILSEGSRVGALVDEVSALVAEGRVRQASELVAKRGGTMARVLGTTLENLSRVRAEREDVIHEAILREMPGIERFSSAILVFAAVAPLLGLLGTVTGMISTFDVITEFGTGDPRMLSGGISEALITTKLGLVVAIPALLGGTLLNGRADAVLAAIQHGTLKVLNAADRPAPARSTVSSSSQSDKAAPVLGLPVTE